MKAVNDGKGPLHDFIFEAPQVVLRDDRAVRLSKAWNRFLRIEARVKQIDEIANTDAQEGGVR